MYAEYAAPMTTMLKGNREEIKKGSKKALVWTAESDRAFEGMKQALLSAVGLHLVDPDRGFVLRNDASDYAVGAVLEQVLDDGRHVPVAFWSRVLAKGQRWTWTPREKTDISAHGDEAETAEAKKIIEMERLMEEEGIKCFVVMAADAPLGTRMSRAVRVLAPEGAESDKHLFPGLASRTTGLTTTPSLRPLRPSIGL